MNPELPKDASAAPTRSCGPCTMCCKVYDVPPIDNKPRGVWCKHCKPGRGCGIWESRPQFCKDFFCNWIVNPSLGEEWRPDRSKLVLNYRPEAGAFMVMVDPGAPGAWRKEPYHSVLKALSGWLAGERHILQVVVNHEVTVVTPDREFPLGPVSGELMLRWIERQGPGASSASWPKSPRRPPRPPEGRWKKEQAEIAPRLSRRRNPVLLVEDAEDGLIRPACQREGLNRQLLLRLQGR